MISAIQEAAMARNRSILIGFLFVVLLAIPTVAQIQPDRTSTDALAKIREEGISHSQVMKITGYLTDVSGPRLTNSPNIKIAAQWVLGKMNEWGIADAKLESWGPFGRGWSNEHFDAAMVKPYHLNIVGSPKAWTPGTNGVLRGDVAIAVVATQADIEKYRGKLKRKVCAGKCAA